MTTGADFVFLAWNGIDGHTFDLYNQGVGTDQIGIFDRNFATSLSPNSVRIAVSVSSGHIVQAVRPYGSSASITIPVGGYTLVAHGTSLPYLSRYQLGDILEVVPTTECEPHTAGVPIVTYHSLGETDAAFEAHLQAIDQAGYTTVSVDDLVAYLGFPSVPLPENPILLTFDDAYDDQFAFAPPLLDEYGMVGNFFVITSFPGVVPWVATWSEINTALTTYPDSVVLACHSHDAHFMVGGEGAYVTPINGETQEEYLDRRFLDLYDCRDTLFAETGVDTVSIAWPFGAYDEGLVNQAHDAGFLAMFNTWPGLNVPDNDGALGNIRRFGGNISASWSVVEATMDRWFVCP